MDMTMLSDIVCGMGIEEDGPETFVKTYGAKTYHFCSCNCLLLFTYEPLYYTSLRYETARDANALRPGMDTMSKIKHERAKS
jgi:YHS domain-containing protein